MSAFPERPHESVPPERPQVPDRAPTFPKKIWGLGSRAPAGEAGAGAGAAASEAVPPWPPELPDPPWPPEFPDPPWPPELQDPPGLLSCLRVP